MVYREDKDDPEEPDEADRDPDGEEGVDLIECPHCGEEVYEYAQQCPKCGKYFSEERRRARTNQPIWVVLTAAALLMAILWGWMRWM